MLIETLSAVAPVRPETVSSPEGEVTRPPTNRLRDVADFAAREDFPRVWWLTPVRLKQPRSNIKCLNPSTRLGKRVLDVCLSAVMLVLLAPIMLLVAALVKLTSPGPVIFRQTRVGLNLRHQGRRDRRHRHESPPHARERRTAFTDRRGEFTYGRHFTLYKFRTMRVDAEKNGAQFAQKGDPRVTPVGRFLRRTRLDELPQLWNVLIGEMSLVGPRPERPEFMQKLSREVPCYLDRLGLQPGLTGVAQVLNGYDNEIDSFKRKVAFDLHYLQHCTVWNDFKILIRTIAVVLSGSGAL